MMRKESWIAVCRLSLYIGRIVFDGVTLFTLWQPEQFMCDVPEPGGDHGSYFVDFCPSIHYQYQRVICV